MANTLTYTGTLQILTCWCGIKFAAPSDMWDRARQGKLTIYCPSGHTCRWSAKTDEQVERERRVAAESQVSAMQDQLDASERSRRALKGQVTKAKRRVGNGVCPCCSRHFANVERHMKGQHPEYTETAP